MNKGWGLNFVMVKLVIGVLFLGLVFQLVASAVDVDRLNIWPMPQSVSYGHKALYMSKDFELRTEGSKYPDASGILKDGFSRLLYVINAPHVADGNISHFQQSLVLQGINVLISSANDELQYGTDESYKLSVASSGDPVYAHLEAQTVYGALHGLQTFSQVCHFNFTTRLIEVRQAPWDISDQPRFSYRGLLIDTARHYQPLPMIKKVVDSMSYAKLIHSLSPWRYLHIPNYGMELILFQKDIHWLMLLRSYLIFPLINFLLCNYAQRRGINVLAEIDVPGHAQSWGADYPTLWPSKDCQQPLDVSNEFTFQVIDGILSDFSKVFKFKFVHLGGDEVNTSEFNVLNTIYVTG
ncbi:hypothetical protein RHGRI_027160 [Rhododendron griersonianum]|uniref:beta-N-acetylhexosaminidase n=1 Tax=Rhododendron griersonianum TaxID=479676 RepID=A0AAV6IVB0_9ERIC|nr:hypothetical protein RHGRI_027160 [Rhododendron griersonianum]